MKIKCEYCNNYISDTDEVCPNCNAPNEHLKRTSTEIPKTIEELKRWYIDHNLPDENTTRFFIGKDIKEARAFGIYYDEASGEYIVYKNKDDGTRAIRYNGKDQAYAVNELYIKLKEEIVNQKQHNLDAKLHPTFKSDKIRKENRIKNKILKVCNTMIVLAAIIPCIWLVTYILGSIKYFGTGYYYYKNNVYYAYAGCPLTDTTKCEWYSYNQDNNSWAIVSHPSGIGKRNYVGYDWNSTNNKYSNAVTIAKDYKEEDWFKQKHPTTPSNGYYIYNNQKYYYFHGWYIYDNGWRKTEADSNLKVYHNDYYTNDYDTYNSYGSESFYDTDYYKNYDYSSSHNDSYDSSSSSSYNDDWDSSSSWDSDSSWDSGSTDWSSDW